MERVVEYLELPFRTTTEQHNANVQGAEDMQLAYTCGWKIDCIAHANSIEQTWNFFFSPCS